MLGLPNMFPNLVKNQSSYSLFGLVIFLLIFSFSCGSSASSDSTETINSSESTDSQRTDQNTDGTESSPEMPEKILEGHTEQKTDDMQPSSSTFEEIDPTEINTPKYDRVVILGEEFLLSDALAMGLTPIAATATLSDRFVGINRETDMIQPLPSTEANFELLASLQPDLIVTTQNLINTVSLDMLEEIATTKVVTSTDWRQRVIELGEIFETSNIADEILNEYDTLISETKQSLASDLTVSVVTVYPGNTIAVWVDGPSNIPQTLIDLGVELFPNKDTYQNVRYGRAYLSLEQISDLNSPLIILSQSNEVSGESDSLDEIEKNSLWQNLPAVKSGNVMIINRLGYPGVEGRMRLIKDFREGLTK